MSKNILQKIAHHREAIEALEKQKKHEYERELADLKKRYGLASDAMKTFTAKPKVSRRRAKITPKVIAMVVDMVAKNATTKEIAKALRISAATANNIKKAEGLVKARKKK